MAKLRHVTLDCRIRFGSDSRMKIFDGLLLQGDADVPLVMKGMAVKVAYGTVLRVLDVVVEDGESDVVLVCALEAKGVPIVEGVRMTPLMEEDYVSGVRWLLHEGWRAPDHEELRGLAVKAFSVS